MLDMHKEDLDGSEMKIFPYNDVQVVNLLN